MLTSKLKRIIAVCLILVMGFLLLSPTANVISIAYIVLLPVFVLFLTDDFIAYRRKRYNCIWVIQLQAPDLFVFLLFVFELLNAYVFHTSLSGQLVANRLLVMLLMYLFGRFYLDTFQSVKILACGLAVFGMLVGTLIVFSSFRFFEYVGSYGFSGEQIVPLRYLFQPAGIMINDWSGVLLAFLPFAFFTVFVLPEKWKYVGIMISAVITLAILHSLSRGAWLALFVFGILLIPIVVYFRVVPLHKSIRSIGVYLMLVAAGSYPLYKAAKGMVVIKSGSSQVQSVTGRLDRWRDCVEIIHSYPLVGIGNGNYALESMVIANRDGSSYTRRVNNVVLQIVLEKGLVGLTLYLGFLILLWRKGLAGLKRTGIGKERLLAFAVTLFTVGSIALLVREMTFTTLLEIPICMYLFVCMALMIVNMSVYEKKKLLT